MNGRKEAGDDKHSMGLPLAHIYFNSFWKSDLVWSQARPTTVCSIAFSLLCLGPSSTIICPLAEALWNSTNLNKRNNYLRNSNCYSLFCHIHGVLFFKKKKSRTVVTFTESNNNDLVSLQQSLYAFCLNNKWEVELTPSLWHILIEAEHLQLSRERYFASKEIKLRSKMRVSFPYNKGFWIVIKSELQV